MRATFFTSLLLGVATAASLPQRRDDASYMGRANAAIGTLQSAFYNSTTGAWNPTNQWWNDANAMTSLADLRAMDPSQAGFTDPIFKQVYNMQQKNSNGAFTKTGWLDDRLWWVIAFIRAYDSVNDPSYLSSALATFDGITSFTSGAGKGDCGGIYNQLVPAGGPNPQGLVKDSVITGLLYMHAAAQLALRNPARHDQLLQLAEEKFQWVYQYLLVDPSTLMILGDLVDKNNKQKVCQNDGVVLSYHEGVAINGLVSLYHATNNEMYLDVAEKIANATIADKSRGLVTDDNIQNEAWDGTYSCTGNTAQFKGILTRGLKMLWVERNNAVNGTLATFILAQSDSIWNVAKNADGKLGQNWHAPYYVVAAKNKPYDVAYSPDVVYAAHNSATMALVQAADVYNRGGRPAPPQPKSSSSSSSVQSSTKTSSSKQSSTQTTSQKQSSALSSTKTSSQELSSKQTHMSSLGPEHQKQSTTTQPQTTTSKTSSSKQSSALSSTKTSTQEKSSEQTHMSSLGTEKQKQPETTQAQATSSKAQATSSQVQASSSTSQTHVPTTTASAPMTTGVAAAAETEEPLTITLTSTSTYYESECTASAYQPSSYA